MSADLDLIKSRLSLRSLAEEAGAQFKTDSSPCPLHSGDNPTAFRLYADDQRWHCFTHCPQDRNDGDLITFYMRWRNLDFKTVVIELANHAGLNCGVLLCKTPKQWTGDSQPLPDYLDIIQDLPNGQPG